MIPFLLVLLLSAQEGPAGPPEKPQEAPSWLGSLAGTLSLKYRLRWTSDESDNDLYEFVTLTCGNPREDLVTASASARLAEDLDGERDEQGAFAFDSLDDTYRRATTARLYTAYLDVHRLWPGARLRAGRQVLEELPEAVPMDGGTLRMEVFEAAQVGLFAGLPINLFESSPRGDAAYGGWVRAAPWARGAVRLEYLHLEDENLFGAFDDDLFGLTVEQGAGPVFLHARHTWLERENRESTLRATGAFPGEGLVLYAQGTYLHERQQALSFPIDPYAAFLTELEPYIQLSLGSSKTFGSHFAIDVSLTKRELVRDADEAAYNREFSRWNVTPRLDGWPLADVSLAVFGDFWQSSWDDFWTLGGEVAWRAAEVLTLSAGSSYALFVVDAFTGQERERVRLLHTALRWKAGAAQWLDVRFSIEDSQADRFRTLELGTRHAF